MQEKSIQLTRLPTISREEFHLGAKCCKKSQAKNLSRNT